jgi:non-heme chloroperoxidase
VFALDLRGHGNSDRPASGYHTRDLAADVIAFMDAQKIVRATIIGHSMGSFVAQQVALAAPQRVSRMVLVGSATEPGKFAELAGFAEVVYQLAEPVSSEFARDFQVSTIYKNVSAEFVDRAVEESLKLPARVWRELMKGMLATSAPVGLSRSNIPTLIIRGDKDTYALQSEQEALARMIRTARVKVYTETGHAVHWERPAEFVRDVQAFVAASK